MVVQTLMLWLALNALWHHEVLLSKINQIRADITQCGSQLMINE